MSLIFSSVFASLDGGEQEAKEKVKKQLHGQNATLSVRRKSVDARKGDVKFCFAIEAHLSSEKEEEAYALRNPQVQFRREEDQEEKYIFTPKIPPVVVGFGPAGMFCALTLARAGAKPIVIERGPCMEERIKAVEGFWQNRVLNANANVQFGEGGAGTFSDGKLTTGIHDPLCDRVLKEFVLHGADEKILTQAHPHIGTDVIRRVVVNIRKEIESLGGRVLFQTTLQGLKQQDGKLVGVITDKGEIETESVALCIGHSARDTFENLYSAGLVMERKPFSVGFRCEQKQEITDRAMYGRFAGHPALPPAEYKFSHREGDRGVYTFCMCPGGYVVPASSEEGGVVVNGMSYSGRNGENSNAAFVASVLPQDFEGNNPLSGMLFQRKLEQNAFQMAGGDYTAPAQTAHDFLQNQKSTVLGAVKPTYACGVTLCDMNLLFPKAIADLLKQGIVCFNRNHLTENALLTGVETRTSSPLRILRKEDGQSVTLSGFYPCGEGAGYAGGIMSAAVDGMKTAYHIIKREG